MTSVTRYSLIALAFLALQGGFWWKSFGKLPDLGVVPNVMSEQEIELLSFGDAQLFFRMIAFRLNNAGDTFGRFTTLRAYDMEKISDWFTKLDTLDNTSNHLPSMSAYYFSQTQNTPDVRYLVEYLYNHAKDRPDEKWWWLTQATYLAMHKLEDKDLALRVSAPLEGVRGIPHWAQQMPAFVHEQRGELEDAYIIMKNILEESNTLDQSELNYMRYFMEERLDRLQEVEGLIEQRRDELTPP